MRTPIGHSQEAQYSGENSYFFPTIPRYPPRVQIKPPKHLVAAVIVYCSKTRRMCMVSSRDYPNLWTIPMKSVDPNSEVYLSPAATRILVDLGVPRFLILATKTLEVISTFIQSRPHMSEWGIFVLRVDNESDLLNEHNGWYNPDDRKREWFPLYLAQNKMREWHCMEEETPYFECDRPPLHTRGTAMVTALKTLEEIMMWHERALEV